MLKNFVLKSLTLTVLVVAGLFALLQVSPPVELSLNSVTTQKDAFFEVTDTAKVLAPPDTATLQVGVMKEADTVEAVQTDLNTANNAIIAALAALGIPKEDIKTVSFSINPKYRYNPETGEQSIDGYQANSSLEVRTTDFDLINKVIDASAQAGANQIGQVNFVVDNRDEFVAKARQEAIEGAKQKAQEIAKEAGIDLGRLIDVQVFEGGAQPPIYFEKLMSADSALGGGANVQPGQNEIEVTVSLSFALK